MQRITALGVLGFLTYWTIQLFTLEYSQKQFIKSKIGEYDLSKGSFVWVYSDAVGRAVFVIAGQQVKWQFIFHTEEKLWYIWLYPSTIRPHCFTCLQPWCFATLDFIFYAASEAAPVNLFTPKCVQVQISPALWPVILHHIVWRPWLFIAYSEEKLSYYQILIASLTQFFVKGWENVHFELGSERLN